MRSLAPGLIWSAGVADQISQAGWLNDESLTALGGWKVQSRVLARFGSDEVSLLAH